MFTTYKHAIERFKQEGIEYDAGGVNGKVNNLWLSKDGFKCITAFDFESEGAEQRTEAAIQAFLKLVEMNKKEQERQAKKAERAAKAKAAKEGK